MHNAANARFPPCTLGEIKSLGPVLERLLHPDALRLRGSASRPLPPFGALRPASANPCNVNVGPLVML